jgi:histidinol-phosphate aminotransferase
LNLRFLTLPLYHGGLAQLARVLAWQARGHRFESDILHIFSPIRRAFFIFSLSKIMDFNTLVRSHILNLSPYSSARDEYTGTEGVFLDANENPYSSVTKADYNRYPDPYQWNLKTKLAKLKGTKVENIFLGNGSDEPIDLLIKLVCEPKESNIVIMPPTYGMYKVCADIQEIFIQQAPLTEDFQIDMDNVFDAVNSATKIIWVCSPNNPSGNSLNPEHIIQIIKSFPEKIIAVDEAYIDFTDSPSFLNRLPEFENLVVLQTFSKAWGMAGLRIGVAYAHPTIIKLLNKIKYPYNLNMLTQAKAIEALDNEDVKNQFVKQILENREWLKTKLEAFSFVEKVYPSDSNSLLVKFENAKFVYNYLISQKVILRDRSNVALCENCIRISIGSREELQILLDKLGNL